MTPPVSKDQHSPENWMMVAVRPAGQHVVIVGGGAVARRRAMLFARHGAEVKVYDPYVAVESQPWPDGVTFYKRRAGKRDLHKAWLVIAATNDPGVNQQVALWADELGLEINRADEVNQGTFAVPSLIENKDGWQLAILGGEAGPLFSAWLKGLLQYVITLPKISRVYKTLALTRSSLRGQDLTQKQRADAMRDAMATVLEADSDPGFGLEPSKSVSSKGNPDKPEGNQLE